MKKLDSKTKKQKILDLKANYDLTAKKICKLIDITEQTYYRWLKNSAFKLKYDQAVKNRLGTRCNEAKKSLSQLVSGYEFKEVRTEYTPDPNNKAKEIVKSRTVTTKHIKPDTAAVIFTLCNLAPDQFQNTQRIDHKEIDPVTKIEVEIIRPQKELIELKQALLRSSNKSNNEQ